MRKKVVSGNSEETVSVGFIDNTDSIGFISSDGQHKGFIARVGYRDYQPIRLSNNQYYGKIDGTKEDTCRILINIGADVIQFSSDDELKKWLLK